MQTMKLGKLAQNIIDYRGKSVPKSDSGVPLITARNIRQGFIDFKENEFISSESFVDWASKGFPAAGDVLITTEAPLGMVALFPEGKYAIGQRVICIQPNHQLVDPKYLMYQLLSESGQRKLYKLSSGSTALGIKQSELKKIEVLLLPLEEQKKIAQILSTWDEAIEAVEELIEKKKKMNKSLMRRLLENDELPQLLVSKVIKDSVAGEYGADPNEGCPEDFELLNLLRSTNFTNEGWIDYSSVVTRCISKKKFQSVLLQQGDIVLEKSGGSPNQPVGRVVYFESESKFGYVNFLQRLVVNPNYDSRYIFYALKQYYESKKVLRYQQQTTGIINFQLSDFLKTAKIRIPDSIEEQKSISSTLSDGDKHIQLLLRKKTLLVKQKKGLMQRLLTGKVRVN